MRGTITAGFGLWGVGCLRSCRACDRDSGLPRLQRVQQKRVVSRFLDIAVVVAALATSFVRKGSKQFVTLGGLRPKVEFSKESLDNNNNNNNTPFDRSIPVQMGWLVDT